MSDFHTPICDLLEIEVPIFLAGMGGCYSGKPMRNIANPYIEERERNPELILRFPEQSIESSRAGVMNLTLDTWEVMDPNRSCMPAGQGVGGIDEILPAGEIVRRILAEARATIRRLETLL
jgi:enoyl-[acyl-carrier protein] reductase II